SITAAFHCAAAGPDSGSNRCANAYSPELGDTDGWGRPANTRSRTRRILVSSTAWACENANEDTAAAVYRPTPGSPIKVSKSAGTSPSNSSTIALAAACKRTARRGYPSRPHATIASPESAAAKSAGDGYFSIHSDHTGS